MRLGRWAWLLVLVALGLGAASCARKAEEKVAEAGQDLKDAWKAEREAAWAEMRHGFVAAYHDLTEASVRARERLAAGA